MKSAMHATNFSRVNSHQHHDMKARHLLLIYALSRLNASINSLSNDGMRVYGCTHEEVWLQFAKHHDAVRGIWSPCRFR